MASGDTLLTFHPYDNEPPATLYAPFDVRNSHPVLAYNDSTEWYAIFTGLLPRHYGGGGITVYLTWTAVATSGTVGWHVAFERVGTASQDIDSDGFASDQTVTAATVPATSGNTAVTNVAVSSGASMDSIAIGEVFRLRIGRDTASDSATGNAQLVAVELKET